MYPLGRRHEHRCRPAQLERSLARHGGVATLRSAGRSRRMARAGPARDPVSPERKLPVASRSLLTKKIEFIENHLHGDFSGTRRRAVSGITVVTATRGPSPGVLEERCRKLAAGYGWPGREPVNSAHKQSGCAESKRRRTYSTTIAIRLTRRG